MRNILFVGCAMLVTFALSSCSNSMDNVLENEMEEIPNLILNKDTIVTRGMDPWDEDKEKTPLEWAEYNEGTDHHQPTGANYFYITNDPDYISGEEYNYYAFFDWYAWFEESYGYDNCPQNHLMQIQYRYAGEDNYHWRYIHMPDNNYGLVKILYDGVLENISAYAFPYEGGPIEIRLRTIHKSYLTSTPTLDGDGYKQYDRSMFSAWSSGSDGYVGDYYNPWGHGKPQPSTPDNEEVGNEDFLLLTLNFPFQGSELIPAYTFSYQVYYTNGGYANTYNGSSISFQGISKVQLPKIGKKGGDIEIFVTCTETKTKDYDYAVKNLSYSPSENTMDVVFYMSDFDFYDNDDILLNYRNNSLSKCNN